MLEALIMAARAEAQLKRYKAALKTLSYCCGTDKFHQLLMDTKNTMKNNAATWMPALRDGITYHKPENAPHPGPGYRYLTSLELGNPPADTEYWGDYSLKWLARQPRKVGGLVMSVVSYRTKAPLPKEALPEKPVVGRCYDVRASTITLFIGRYRADGGFDVLVSHNRHSPVGSTDYGYGAEADWEVPEPDIAPVAPAPEPPPLAAGDRVKLFYFRGDADDERYAGEGTLLRPAPGHFHDSVGWYVRPENPELLDDDDRRKPEIAWGVSVVDRVPPMPRALVAGDWVSVREHGDRILGVTQLVRPLTDGIYCGISGYPPWVIDPPVYAPIEHTFFSTWGVRPEDRILENPPEIIKQPDPSSERVAELETLLRERDEALNFIRQKLAEGAIISAVDITAPTIQRIAPNHWHGNLSIAWANPDFVEVEKWRLERLEHLEEVASLASDFVAARAEQAEIGSEVMRAFKVLKGVISK